MAASYKSQHAKDAETLMRIRKLLDEAAMLALELSPRVLSSQLALLRHGIELACEQSRAAHESAHFGATDKLLEDDK